MAHCAGADHRNGFNLFRTATWAAHLAENRAKASRSLGTTQIDYPNIRSYTIRSTEKAILSCLNGILNMNSSLCNREARTRSIMPNETIKRDVVIIGSGPAGLTAAIYTARASLKPLLIDAPADAHKQTAPGGQLMITTDVENYPGFSKGIQGPELMDEFRRQAERFGTEFMETWITEVDLTERPFQLYTETQMISTETLIIASGASAKWLGIPGEAKVPHGFGGNGVSA